MAGVRDLFTKKIPGAIGTGAGQVARGFDVMREKAADAVENVRSRMGGAGGLRGAEPKAADTIPQGRRVKPFNPVEGQAPGVAQQPRAARPSLRGAARLLGRTVPVLAAADTALKVSEGDTPEQRAGGSALRGAAAEFGDTMALGYGREIGTGIGAGAARFVQTPGGLRNRFGAAIEGFREGFRDAEAAEGSAGSSPVIPSAQAAQPAQRGPRTVADAVPTPQPAQAAAPVQPALDPEGMLAGTAPVPSGTGAFRRAGGRAQALRSAEPQVGAQATPQGGFGPVGDFVRTGAQLAGERFARAEQRDARELGIKAAAAGAAARTARTSSVEKEIKDEVARDPALKGLEKEEREAAVEQRTSDLANRFRRTAASQNKDLGDLTPVETSQYRLANKFRESLANRGLVEWFQDFFGDKRYDSENLLHYMPSDWRPGALGGQVNLGGNWIQVNKVTRNGKTHWFSPNDPTDTDMTALVEIARLRKKGVR